MTGSDRILEKSFQYSIENKLKGGETAGHETSWETPAVILVTLTPAQKGRGRGTGSKMKTEKKIKEETLQDLVTGSTGYKVKTMVF